MRTPAAVLAALLSIASLGSCGERRPPLAAAGGERVVARVNGATITDLDVEQRTRGGFAGGGPGHEVTSNVVQTLVRDELIYQKGMQLGLDRDPGYRRGVDELHARLHAFERQQMSVLYRQWIRSLAQVTDAEARDYFEKNAAFIRTRFHVLQILHRGNPADVARDGEDARRGTPFEEIAARRFPSLPEGPKAPWDLGELYWHQIPPAWRGVVDRLEPGQISGVIEGPGDRRWIVKLAGKTVDPAIGFEGEKERIVAFLREQRAQEIEERMLGELKASAVVVYSR